MNEFVSVALFKSTFTKLSKKGSMHLLRYTIMSFRVIRAILETEDLNDSANLTSCVTRVLN